MTLVELLVVVAIIGLLAVTVLPSLATTTESRRTREAADMVTSFIAKAQTRALGRGEWSGFMLVPTPSTVGSFAAADLFLADVPQRYCGDTVPALLTFVKPASGATGMVTGTSGQLQLSGNLGANLRSNDLIRFGDRDPWYELAAPSTTGTSLLFRIRGDLSGGANISTNSENAGQRQNNTPWPAENVPLSFEVLRQPLAVGSPTTLLESRVIDLYWSGFGPPLASGTTYSRFDVMGSGTNPTPGASTSILFDGTGRVRQVQVRTPSRTRRLTVTGAIFLLVGRADRVMRNPGDPTDSNHPGNFNSADDSTGANWQYRDSQWIGIDPLTAVARSAPCADPSEDLNRNNVLDPGEDYNGNGILDRQCPVSSQRAIRQLLLTGGN